MTYFHLLHVTKPKNASRNMSRRLLQFLLKMRNVPVKFECRIIRILSKKLCRGNLTTKVSKLLNQLALGLSNFQETLQFSSLNLWISSAQSECQSDLRNTSFTTNITQARSFSAKKLSSLLVSRKNCKALHYGAVSVIKTFIAEGRKLFVKNFHMTSSTRKIPNCHYSVCSEESLSSEKFPLHIQMNLFKDSQYIKKFARILSASILSHPTFYECLSIRARQK